MAGLLGALSDPQFRADVGQGLLGALNRGAVGGLLGGPVDIATMAMRPLGYRVEKPVGGSEWIGDQMERMGIVGPQRNAVAETLASVTVPAAMAKAAPAVFAAEQAIPKAVEKYGMAAERAIAPAVTRGLERGGLTREMLLAMGNNTRSNITVYHGSPHKFAKFDSSKIGTGEGAQAYGHGLYLAESPSVAKSYADTLSTYHIATKDGVKGGGDFADALVANAGQYPASLSSAIRSQANKISTDLANGKPAEQIIASMRNGPYARMYGGLADAVEKLSPSKAGGSLYKVDLPDSAVARMLDWDKPLSQQPQNVRNSLDVLRQANPQGYQRLVDAQLGGPLMEQAAGMDLYRNLIKGANERQMAEVMRQQGIPGIRYLDGGSRGAGTGTSNFVVFPGEESLLTILERNGMPLPK